MFDSSAINRPVGTAINKETPFIAAEKRIEVAFCHLQEAMGRLNNTIAPIINPSTPEGAQKDAEQEPCTQFEKMIDRTVRAIERVAKEIYSICDRSVI
jgi:hypothetical protein